MGTREGYGTKPVHARRAGLEPKTVDFLQIAGKVPACLSKFLGELDQKLGRGPDFRAVGSRPNSEDLPRKQAQQLLVQEQRNAARYSKTQQRQQRRVGQR